MSIAKQKLTEKRKSEQFLPPPIEVGVSLLVILMKHFSTKLCNMFANML